MGCSLEFAGFWFSFPAITSSYAQRAPGIDNTISSDSCAAGQVAASTHSPAGSFFGSFAFAFVDHDPLELLADRRQNSAGCDITKQASLKHGLTGAPAPRVTGRVAVSTFETRSPVFPLSQHELRVVATLAERTTEV